MSKQEFFLSELDRFIHNICAQGGIEPQAANGWAIEHLLALETAERVEVLDCKASSSMPANRMFSAGHHRARLFENGYVERPFGGFQKAEDIEHQILCLAAALAEKKRRESRS